MSMLAMSSLLLTACGNNERQEFIDASVESTCMFFETGANLDEETLTANAKAIFEKHGFSSSDEDLQALADKYNNDDEVAAAVLEGIKQCTGDVAPEALETDEEAATEDDTTVEEEATSEDIDVDATTEDPQDAADEADAKVSE